MEKKTDYVPAVKVIGILGSVKEEHEFDNEQDRSTWVAGFMAGVVSSSNIKPEKYPGKDNITIIRLFY